MSIAELSILPKGFVKAAQTD